MKNIFVLLALLCLTFSACEQPETSNIISATSRFSNYKLSVDTVRIQLTEHQQFIYPKFGTFEHNDSLYMVGYNQQRHSFDFFNLDDQSFKKSIKLEKEGPNAISFVVGFTPVDINSLYILSEYQVSLIDEKGSIQEKVRINVPSSPIANHNSDEYMFWVETNEPLYYDASKNSLYGMNHSYLHGPCDPQRYKEASLITRLDLDAQRLSTLPIGYPLDKQELSYGFINKIFTQWTDESLVYNFQHDPNIYVMDRESKSVKIYNGKSEYTNNTVSTMSWNQCQNFSQAQEHFVREVNFGKALIDPYNGLLYRFHRKELSIDYKESLNMNKKKLFLSIFDDQFSKVGEFIIKNRPYPSHIAFTGQKGLYVAAPEGTEETLVFYIFKISLTS